MVKDITGIPGAAPSPELPSKQSLIPTQEDYKLPKRGVVKEENDLHQQEITTSHALAGSAVQKAAAVQHSFLGALAALSKDDVADVILKHPEEVKPILGQLSMLTIGLEAKNWSDRNAG